MTRQAIHCTDESHYKGIAANFSLGPTLIDALPPLECHHHSLLVHASISPLGHHVPDQISTTLPLITDAFRNLIRFFDANQRYTRNKEGKAFDGTTSHLWMSQAVLICSGSATALRSGQADFSREEEGVSERAGLLKLMLLWAHSVRSPLLALR